MMMRERKGTIMKTIDDWKVFWANKAPGYLAWDMIREVQRDALRSAANDLLRKSACGPKLHTGEPMTETVPWIRARSKGYGNEND